MSNAKGAFGGCTKAERARRALKRQLRDYEMRAIQQPAPYEPKPVSKAHPFKRFFQAIGRFFGWRKQ